MMIDGMNVTSLRRNGHLVWTEESGLPYPEVWNIDQKQEISTEIKQVLIETPQSLVEENPIKINNPLNGNKSKKELAQEIFNSDPLMSRDQCIQRFMEELNMTKAGASTYFANCKKISK